jgi:hypothetical protein
MNGTGHSQRKKFKWLLNTWKQCSTPSAIKEMHITSSQSEWLSSRCRDELLYTVHGNVNLCNYYGNQHGGSSENDKIDVLQHCHAISNQCKSIYKRDTLYPYLLQLSSQ